MKTKTKAFTLAEVLITLGVIGVIAAITIPSLIQNANERATVTALKKTYSVLSNAFNLAVEANGTPDTWNGYTTRIGLSKLAPFLILDKDCLDGSSGCFPAGVAYKYSKPAGDNGIYDDLAYPKVRLQDGTLIIEYARWAGCVGNCGSTQALQNVCAYIDVDINGYKPPNQFGTDLFRFYITKYGIVPQGSQQETWYTFAIGCQNQSTSFGYGCTGWVLQNENLDYLHCNNLAWGTKTTCN